MLDYGRIKDLEELTKALKNARNTEEKQHLEKIMYRITKESTQIQSLRNELMGAVRANDISKIKRLQAHIQAVRLDETRGSSWGQNKGEQKIYS